MNLDAVRAHSELLSGLSGRELQFLESVSQEAHLRSGDLLFEEDGVANTFYIILQGKVGLEMTSPGKPPIVIQTLGDGELVGVSWLFPPYRWTWRARAVTDTSAVAFDAAKVRAQFELDSELAHRLLSFVTKEAIGRLHSTRVQLLDLYRKR